MGFTQMFLKSYLTSSNNKIFYGNFFQIKPVLFLDYKKVIFSLIFASQGNWTPQPGQLDSSTKAKPWLPWSIYGPEFHNTC